MSNEWTLLHSPEVELSRKLLASKLEGVRVVEWGTPEAAEFVYVSAFPTVIIPAPEHSIDKPEYNENTELVGVVKVNVPAYLEYLRMPASWDVVAGYAEFVNNRALANPPIVDN